VAEYCVNNGIRLIAHRPLGGPRRAARLSKDLVLAEIGQRHRATPHEIALAWLKDLSHAIVPIPGATRIDTVKSIARAHAIALADRDRVQLAERFPTLDMLRHRRESGRPPVAAR